jgi:hypothetical protein
VVIDEPDAAGATASATYSSADAARLSASRARSSRHQIRSRISTKLVGATAGAGNP